MTKPWRNTWKKPELQELVTFFPVFANFKVTVVIANDLQAAADFISDRDYLNFAPRMTSTEAFTVSQPDSGYSNIYLKPNAAIGTIAHETYHAVCAMFKMIGAAEEHEVVAYHLGYLVNLIAAFNLKVADKFKKGTKTKKTEKTEAL